MLTQRSRYGLRAMILLARETAGGPPVPMSHIAAEAVVPRKFLEIILTELKNANLVVSTRGKQGGFHLDRPAELISFGDVIRVIEGPLALVPCVSRTAFRKCDDCPTLEGCSLREALLRARDYDWVIDAQGLLKSRVLGKLAGGRLRIGYDSKEPGKLWLHRLVQRFPEGHVQRRYIGDEHAPMLQHLIPFLENLRQTATSLGGLGVLAFLEAREVAELDGGARE